MAKVRVALILLTMVVVGTLGYFVSLVARGYQFDRANLRFLPNGILAIKSDPDGASIFIDGKLTGATNSNLRLAPKTYDLRVEKEGFLPWSKRITIKKEEVTQVTAELFRTAPSLSPITFDGAANPVLSPDFTRVAYINDNILWLLTVSNLPIGFNNSPKKITDGVEESAKYIFSPDGRQILLTQGSAHFLLETNEFVSQSQRINVTNKLAEIQKNWEEESKTILQSKMRGLPNELTDILIKKTSNLTFSPDEKMILYTASGEATLKEGLIPPIPGSSTQKESRDIKPYQTYVYDIKEDKNFLILDKQTPLYWLPSSRHLIIPEENKIIISDYDGTNKQAVFNGSYISPHAYPFLNNSKLLILTNFGSNENAPNLYSLSIK